MKKYLIKIMILMMFILCVGCSDINNKDKTEEKKEYTVKFIVDGVENTEVIIEGEKVKRPNNPTKEGYVFLGWYIGNELFNFEVDVTSDLEIKAKFEEDIPELIYNDILNPYIKVYSNYSYNELSNEIEKNDTIYLTLYAASVNNVNGVTANLTSTLNNGEKINFGQKENDADKITTHAILYAAQKIHNDNFKSFIVDVFYKYKDNDQEKSDTIVYKENVIKLSLIDKALNAVNDFNKETCEIDGEIIKLFTSFKVECKKYSNPERVTITQKMGISQNLKGVYHLDIQMYGVKDNKEYPLVGYYNLSNNILSSYSQNVTVSSKLKFDYIYVKCKFIDCNGKTHNLLYKEEYSKLIK